MDKKEYLKPVSALVDIEIDVVMTTVSGETTGSGTGEGSAGDGDGEDLVRPSRGEWGDLWHS